MGEDGEEEGGHGRSREKSAKKGALLPDHGGSFRSGVGGEETCWGRKNAAREPPQPPS